MRTRGDYFAAVSLERTMQGRRKNATISLVSQLADRIRALPFVIGLAMVVPSNALACEPAMALAMLFMGPLALVGLAYVGLVIALKCLLFALWQKSLPKWRAASYMLAGNAVSSVIGVLVGLLVGVPPLWLISLPVFYAVSLPAARHAVSNPDWPRLARRSPSSIAVWAVIALVLTLFLYLMASGLAADAGPRYWLVKLAYVELAVFLSVGLTVFWETGVVASLAAIEDPRLPFLPAALRANIVALGLLFGGAAVMVLPKRLRAPDFLVEVFHELWRLA